ncbi:hypothetical protein IIC65_03260, partial [Candidatus Sumerlaeota bacterium]|nr:hypothetical protein [Candidatus Sumerlaeota bacterium]
FYALPFLAMAGWDVGVTHAPQKSMQPGVSSPGIAARSSPGGEPSAFSIPVIPFSLRPDPAPAPPRGTRFIYGGFFLPWQDISATLNVVMEELEAAGKGELIFVGGAHPHLDVSGGSFEELADRLSHHPRVKFHGPMSYGDYMGLLREGGIALDLMARNPERELAFTTRTVQFMACGLPVIHDNYSELGEMIERRGAGWTLDPEDREGLRALVRGLLGGEVDPTDRGAAALAFAGEELDWERTIEPLHRFCASPRERSGKTAARLSFEERDARQRKIETELSQTQARLNALRGKRWVRWGMRAFSTRGLMAWPMALLALIVGFLLIPIFWLNDRLPKKA